MNFSDAAAAIPEEGAIPEDGTSPASDPEVGHKTTVRNRRSGNLSQESERYDVGNKGFLSGSERIIKSYDTNNDGSLDVIEIKRIVRDLNDEKNQKKLLQKMAIGSTVSLVASLLGNFGLIWAVLVLTRQLESKDGNLVDSHTGKRLATEARGNLVPVDINEVFTRRLSNIKRRHLEGKAGEVTSPGLHEDMQRLLQEEPFYTMTSCDAACAHEIYSSYKENTATSWTFEDGGTEYTGIAQGGATHTSTGGCDIYGNIVEVGKTEPVFRVECCGTENCEIFFEEGTEGRRQLINKCFSSLATVIEKSKGKMLLKDLSFGDQVLAANGTFRPVVFMAQSNHVKPTSFVQIHTDSTNEAPLETTPDHLIFVVGKDYPVPASQVKVGDRLVGTANKSRIVAKIEYVERDGLYSVYTSDATHVVDGILASSVVETPDVQFGPFKVRFHTFVKRIFAPFSHALCTHVSPHLCTAQVDDGMGGHYNILVKLGLLVMDLSHSIQGVITFSFIGFFVITIASTCIAFALVPATLVLGSIVLMKKKKVKVL